MAIAYQSGEIINDQYRITDILGKGGVAITYSAISLETESPVAIKVISLKQLPDWKEIELFQREAEVLAKLDHPAIPQYIDYFTLETETDKVFYIVQEQAPGKSLAQLAENGWHTNEQEVKNIAQQILEILIYLHSLDPPVIHRDIKPKDSRGQTPLFWARNVHIAKVLINNGADVNAKDSYGQTPLFIFARLAYISKIKLLIKMGANVNAKDNSGQTPLFFARYQNVANLLIKNGADINIKDNLGNRPKNRFPHYSRSDTSSGFFCTIRCRHY